jgi:TetR/AcrR family transcriptional regulator
MNTAAISDTRTQASGIRLPAALRRAKRPATVERILAAAERMFAAGGMAGARTEEIARAARVNKALLYYYFSSKEKLHLAVLDALFQKLVVAVEAAFSGDSLPRQRLLAYVDAYFDFILRHPNYPRLVQRELMEGGKSLVWIARQYMGPIQRKLSRILEDGMARGEFRAVDPTQTVMTINAMIVSYFAVAPVLSQVLGRDALAKEAVAARRRAILDFLEHGLLRNPSRSRAARKP